MKLCLFKSCLSVATLLATAVLPGLWTRSVSAQELPPLPIEFNPDNLINPGRPGGRRRGGGSRGSCQTEIPLSAIAYATTQTIDELGESRMVESVGALTTQPRPILWFYLPAEVPEMAAELVVQDSREQVVFQGLLTDETERDGIVGLELETDLRVGEPYQWFLTIDCDETERVTVNGWVERRTVGADALRTLSQATERNRVALYAEYGFWQDAVSELAQLRFFETEDEAIAREWGRMLSAMDLGELAEVPILPCCSVSPALEIDEDDMDEGDEVPSEEGEFEGEVVPEDASEEEAEEEESEEEEDDRTILQRARDRG